MTVLPETIQGRYYRVNGTVLRTYDTDTYSDGPANPHGTVEGSDMGGGVSVYITLNPPASTGKPARSMGLGIGLGIS